MIAMLAFAGCGADKAAPTSTDNMGKLDNVIVKVGATPVPHADILEFAKPLLEKEGVILEVVEMTDYIQPNLALADNHLDANFFQHKPYLDKFCAERNLKLTSVASVHIEPMGVYAGRKVHNLRELESGSIIAVPNDPTNRGRALLFLHNQNVFTLKEGVTTKATASDIVSNPKSLIIAEVEAPQLPRMIDNGTIAVINTNFAMQAGLDPAHDAIALEDSHKSPFANIVAVRAGDEKRPEIQKLVKVLTSDEVKQFIEEKYKGKIIPAL